MAKLITPDDPRDYYLEPGEPLFEKVRRAAMSQNSEAGHWLALSARHWARGEFARRLRLDDYEWRMEITQVEERVLQYRRCQVAVQTKEDHVYVGMMGAESTAEFLRLQTMAGQYISGTYSITDVFRLPEQWTLAPWPWQLKRADGGDFGIAGPFKAATTKKVRRACGACWGRGDKRDCRTCDGSGIIEVEVLQDGVS